MNDSVIHIRAHPLVEKPMSEGIRYNTVLDGFQPYMSHPNDVIVATWLKCGTTSVQERIYQLMCATGRVATDPEGEGFHRRQ